MERVAPTYHFTLKQDFTEDSILVKDEILEISNSSDNLFGLSRDLEGSSDRNKINNNQDGYDDTATVISPWQYELVEPSLPEINGTIKMPEGENVSCVRKFMAFIGPGALVAVGYMDPGNWSTDIAGGAMFGYSLLCIILFSSLVAMFLQALSCKSGIATNRDLAQSCRDLYPKSIVYMLWVVMEIAIMATDVAEVVGSAIALKLLFGIPLVGGVFITVADVLLLLMLQGRSFRFTEAIVALLIILITVCFAIEIGLSKPVARDLFRGFIPDQTLFTDNNKLFIAIGIIGATVMPHNLFLHSSIVLTRDMKRDPKSLRQYTSYSQWDSNLSLCGALFVNCAILILAAATFYEAGENDVADLETAYQLLAPLLGNNTGQLLFGIALLASGLNATLTGTLTGQIVMEGFTQWTISPIYRRLITRILAIIPAVVAIAVGGEGVVTNILIWSQVILSFALPFAIFPLMHITSNELIMGELVNSRLVQIVGYIIGVAVIVLNILSVLP